MSIDPYITITRPARSTDFYVARIGHGTATHLVHLVEGLGMYSGCGRYCLQNLRSRRLVYGMTNIDPATPITCRTCARDAANILARIETEAEVTA